MGIYAPPQGAWTSYTPTTTVTGATLGNGVSTGGWWQSGKTVTFWASFVVGSTTNFTGLTNIIMTLPTTMASSFAASSVTFGTGNALISTSYYFLSCLQNSSTSIRPIALVTATNGKFADITSSTPAGWAVGSSLFVTGTYETV